MNRALVQSEHMFLLIFCVPCALCADVYSDCMRFILMSDYGRVRASALDENQQTQTAFTLAASRFVRERRQTNLPV